jgi:valyl-tRNA synthetase
VERLFQTYQYGEAGRQIYEFFWSEFADWYLEIAKEQMKSEGTREQTVSTLARVLDISLRLLHPFTPFVTEELWGHLRESLLDSPLAALARDWPDALIVAPWPEPREEEGWETEKMREFAIVQDVVRSIRNFWAEHNIVPGGRAQAHFAAGQHADLLREQTNVIAALSGLDAMQLEIQERLPATPGNSLPLVVGPIEIFLPLEGMVNLDHERERLSKELAGVQSQIQRLEKLLGGDFASRAPAAVVEREREKLEGYRQTEAKLASQLEK